MLYARKNLLIRSSVMNQIGEGGQSVKKYVAVVSVFIISASLLVVFTTFAINMLIDTGDL